MSRRREISGPAPLGRAGISAGRQCKSFPGQRPAFWPGVPSTRACHQTVRKELSYDSAGKQTQSC